VLPTATSALRADEIAAAFGLGRGARLEGPAARGEQGRVWRLTTSSGDFAVKQSFSPVDPAEAEFDAAFQEVALAAGVPLPGVVRTTEGRVLAEVSGGAVRVHTEPIHPWYVEPVGAEGWAELVADLTTAGAPFAGDPAAVVPRILDVERVLARRPATQVCHMDLWADNVRRTPRPDDAHRPAGPHRPDGSRRWLAEPDPVERLHLEGWVREFLDEPVTRAVAGGIVAAAR